MSVFKPEWLNCQLEIRQGTKVTKSKEKTPWRQKTHHRQTNQLSSDWSTNEWKVKSFLLLFFSSNYSDFIQSSVMCHCNVNVLKLNCHDSWHNTTSSTFRHSYNISLHFLYSIVNWAQVFFSFVVSDLNHL